MYLLAQGLLENLYDLCITALNLISKKLSTYYPTTTKQTLCHFLKCAPRY